jgi:hypothetical protein
VAASCLQDHRRKVAAAAAAAAAARTGGSSTLTGFGRSAADRDAAVQERQRRAEAAAAESAKILREEQTKDSNWRAAMMQQIEQVGWSALVDGDSMQSQAKSSTLADCWLCGPVCGHLLRAASFSVLRALLARLSHSAAFRRPPASCNTVPATFVQPLYSYLLNQFACCCATQLLPQSPCCLLHFSAASSPTLPGRCTQPP